MDDYENAESELKQAIDGDNTEALVLLVWYIWIKETAQSKSNVSAVCITGRKRSQRI